MAKTTDCLIIGFNDTDFQELERLIRAMGETKGAYRDLSWGFLRHDGGVHRCLDILTRFHYEGRPAPPRPFNNSDYLWLVVTYLTTYLRRRGHEVDYINLFQFDKEKLREKLLEGNVRTVAITTTLYVAPHPIIEIVSFIRRYNKETRIIIGGPYVANQIKTVDDEALSDQYEMLGGDIYVHGAEGELALSQVLQALGNGGDLAAIDNIAYRQGGRFVRTGSSQEYNPLEENMIDWSLFPGEEVGEFVTTRTAKSCPFSCAFCGFPQRAGAYKYLPVELVEKELNAINDIGTVSTVAFIDDTFNVPKRRFKELLRMMIRNKYDFKWNCYYRSDHGDEEAIELMAEAGCEGVLLGVESGSDKILENMNKTARRKHYAKAIPLLQSHGISCYASLIIGFPGETFDTVQETLSLIEETRPDFFRPQIWYLDPITPIARQREKYGIEGWGFNWSHNTMDVDTACDLIERCFLGVENSVWLPEHGFEQWSVFYLLRKGMTMEQVKRYVSAFNGAIKERLICPGKQEVSAEMLETIRLAAQFDRGVEPDMTRVESMAGRNYQAAERFWVSEFDTDSPVSNLAAFAGQGSSAEEWNLSQVALEPSTVEAVRTRCEAELPDVLLAASSVLLSRLSDLEETVILAILGGSEESAFPLRLFPRETASFRQLVDSAADRRAASQPHQLYAFHVLTNPIRMGLFNAAPPRLDVGFVYSEQPEDREGVMVARVLEHEPQVYSGVRLVLEAVHSSGQLHFTILSRLRPGVAEELGRCLRAILVGVAENPELTLSEIPIREAEASSPLEAGAGVQARFQDEEFDF